MTGRIERLNPRGFGFVECSVGRVFLHAANLKGVQFDELASGDVLEFEVGADAKGRPTVANARRVEVRS